MFVSLAEISVIGVEGVILIKMITNPNQNLVALESWTASSVQLGGRLTPSKLEA
jgi:hypothetical protein